jgi:uncharacterized circularly permuted ATP-grasp superfamily protein
MNMQADIDEMQRNDEDGGPARQDRRSRPQRKPAEPLERERDEIGALFRRLEFTFAADGEDGANGRLIPFAIVPQRSNALEWCPPDAAALSRIEGNSVARRRGFHG